MMYSGIGRRTLNIDVLALRREAISGVTACCDNQLRSDNPGPAGISFPGMAGMTAVLAANLFGAFAAPNLLSNAYPKAVSVQSISLFGSRGVFLGRTEVDTDVALSATGLSQAFHAIFEADANADLDSDDYSFS